jgi:hypothetical protein
LAGFATFASTSDNAQTMINLSNSSRLNPTSIGCDLHILNLDLNHSIESLVGKRGDMSDSNILQLIYKVSYLCQQNWIETRALLKSKINEILSKKTNPVEKDA